MARSVVPLRYRVASAMLEIGFAGLRSSRNSTCEDGQRVDLAGDLLEAPLDLFPKLVRHRDVASLHLDLHGTSCGSPVA